LEFRLQSLEVVSLITADVYDKHFTLLRIVDKPFLDWVVALVKPARLRFTPGVHHIAEALTQFWVLIEVAKQPEFLLVEGVLEWTVADPNVVSRC